MSASAGDAGPPVDSALRAALEEAKTLGFLGPGPVDAHVEHSAGFVAGWRTVAPDRDPRRLLDLGSGGGVPGLLLARAWPDAEVILLDGSAKRTGWLTEAVAGLGLEGRVQVVAARAEEAARGPLRAAVELVTARGFGPPAVTAECAAGFLAPDGILLVAEPPDDEAPRWPADGLARLGLEPGPRLSAPVHIQAVRRCGPVPDRYPRRVGIPAKRPLWVEPAGR